MNVLEQNADGTAVVEISALEQRILATALARLSGRPNVAVNTTATEMREAFAKYNMWPLQSAYLLPSTMVGVPVGIDLAEEFDDDSADVRDSRARIAAAEAEDAEFFSDLGSERRGA